MAKRPSLIISPHGGSTILVCPCAGWQVDVDSRELDLLVVEYALLEHADHCGLLHRAAREAGVNVILRRAEIGLVLEQDRFFERMEARVNTQ